MPYDVDNDATPDYREIIADPTLDEEGRPWVLDARENWAETGTPHGLRPGLHAPKWDPLEELTGNVTSFQVVRLIGDQTDLEVNPDVGFTNCGPCESRASAFDNWATNTPPASPEPKEIIVLIRTTDRLDESSVDSAPDPVDQPTVLNDTEGFAYRYARCIDFIQFGNEIWGGAGRYKVYDVGACGPGYFNTMGSRICFDAASAEVFDWLQQQIDAARRGSALAGRPLRIIGPAVTMREVNDAGDPHGAESEQTTHLSWFIEDLVDFANRNCIPVDLHLHYESHAEFDSAVQKLLYPVTPYEWASPVLVTALEWGPFPDTAAQGTFSGELEDFYLDSMDTPTRTWELFMPAWEGSQFPTGFDLAGRLAKLSDEGFQQACYGPSLQRGSDGNIVPYDMAAIRANKIKTDWIDDANEFTPLHDAFVLAAAPYVISPFDPHPNGCGASVCDDSCNR